MRTNRSCRFGCSGATVLVASSGDQVSFNTTGGGGVDFDNKLPVIAWVAGINC